MKKIFAVLFSCLTSSAISSTVISCDINSIFSASSPNTPTFKRVNVPNNYQLYTDTQNHGSAVYQSIRLELAKSVNIDVNVLSRIPQFFNKKNKIKYGDDYWNIDIKIFDEKGNLINDKSDDAITANYDDSTIVQVNEQVKLQITVSKSFYFKPTENSVVSYTTILSPIKNIVLPNYENQKILTTFSCTNGLFYVAADMFWYSIDNQNFLEYQNLALNFYGDQIFNNIMDNPKNKNQFYFLINNELYLFDSLKLSISNVFNQKINITAISRYSNDIAILSNNQIWLLDKINIKINIFANTNICFVNLQSIEYKHVNGDISHLLYASDDKNNLYLVEFNGKTFNLIKVQGINFINANITITNVLRNGNNYNGENYTYILNNNMLYVSTNNIDFLKVNNININLIDQIWSTDNNLFIISNNHLYLYDNYNHLNIIIFSDSCANNYIIYHFLITNNNLFYIMGFSENNNNIQFYKNLEFLFSK